MRPEIERKFLVTGDGWRTGAVPVVIRQGYLADTNRASIRIRVAGDRGFLTVKSRPAAAARLTRAEYEYEIPVADANAMLDSLCPGPLIEKVRHTVRHAGTAWVVDVFAGDNAGLIVAEVELEREDQPVALPDWVGEEVTSDSRYLNVNLARAPFRSWRR